MMSFRFLKIQKQKQDIVQPTFKSSHFSVGGQKRKQMNQTTLKGILPSFI